MTRFLILAIAISLVGCGRSGPPVDVVVPRMFNGPIWIILDVNGPAIPLVEGRYHVVIPIDGVLRVNSLRPFQKWHELNTRFEDGTQLPNASEAPSGTVAFWHGGSHSKGRVDGGEDTWISYYVGTSKQHSLLPLTNWPPGIER